MGALGWDVYKESMLMSSGYPDEAAKAFREAADAFAEVLDLRPTVPVTARLGDFLRTRVLELVVHTDDLATSVGIEPPPAAEGAATVAIDAKTAIARAAHHDVAVIRALARGERASIAVFPVL